MQFTKGQLIKDLKKAGIRKGIKNGGAEVGLKHLKYADVVNLWYEHCHSDIIEIKG